MDQNPIKEEKEVQAWKHFHGQSVAEGQGRDVTRPTDTGHEVIFFLNEDPVMNGSERPKSRASALK